MRLIKAHVTGYGRLIDAKINLDSKVIAIVGPNEAGKTTLLKALAYINDGDRINDISRSRDRNVSDDSTIIKASFALTDSDLKLIEHIDLEEVPRMIEVSRLAGGGQIHFTVNPQPSKAKEPLKKYLAKLKEWAAKDEEDINELVREDTIFADPGADMPRSYILELGWLVESVQATLDETEYERHSMDDLLQLPKTLQNVLIEGKNTSSLRRVLAGISEWLDRHDPETEVRQILFSNTPRFLLFGEGDRTLASAYGIDQSLLDNTPQALQNIAKIAELNLDEIIHDSQVGDVARRDTAMNKANRKLATFFAKAWKQSALSVSLSIDGMTLRVSIIENGENVTVFDERSAGLRMFVALVAFLASKETDVPPILLIDEAENHLHIDAQADLVNMFTTQNQVSHIIYSTHSPACLPPDLGLGIRAISPIADSQSSRIENNFWSHAAGFSPLMMAMGAAAAAFTPARCVVLAEGATEMILLPTLLRQATNESDLPYQIAPGLSETSSDFYGSLDFEGAKVAYLVDGDTGGLKLKEELVRKGIPDDKILMLGAPGIENILQQDVYLRTVQDLLVVGYGEDNVPDFPELTRADEASWAKQLDVWAKQNNIKMPSKIAVASELTNHENPLADEYVSITSNLHKELLKVLGLK